MCMYRRICVGKLKTAVSTNPLLERWGCSSTRTRCHSTRPTAEQAVGQDRHPKEQPYVKCLSLSICVSVSLCLCVTLCLFFLLLSLSSLCPSVPLRFLTLALSLARTLHSAIHGNTHILFSDDSLANRRCFRVARIADAEFDH